MIFTSTWLLELQLLWFDGHFTILAVYSHAHSVSGPSSAFQDLGGFLEAISTFLRTQSFWKKAWGRVVCYNRISILDIISNCLTSFFTTAAAANVPLLAEDWNASPCFSQHRSERVTGQLHSVWSSRLVLMWEAETSWHWCPCSAQGKASAGEMYLGAAEVWSMAAYHLNQAKLHFKWQYLTMWYFWP